VAPLLVGLARKPLDHVMEEDAVPAVELGIFPRDFLLGAREERRHRGRRRGSTSSSLTVAGLSASPLYSSSKSMNLGNCLRARFASMGQKKLLARGFSSGLSPGTSIRPH